MPAAASSQTPRSSSYWQQTMQNRMLMVVLSMVVLVPLLASPSNEAMQGLAIRAIQLMAALLAGILVLRARVATSRAEVFTFLETGSNLAVLLFFGSCLLSFALGDYADGSRRLGFAEVERNLAGILLYFALAYHVRRSEHLVKIQDALVLVASLMAILGLITLGTQGTGEKTVLFGDHQLFGAFLMILFPVTIVTALTERDSKRQLAAQIGATLTGICLLMSGTRTAWAGGLVSIIALALFSLIGSPARRKRLADRKTQYIIPVLIVIAGGGLFLVMGGQGTVLTRRLAADSRQDSMDYRRNMWYAAEQLIIRKPLFGTGIGTYALLQEPYSRSGRPATAVIQNRPTLAEMAHNMWLQTAADQGLIGVGLFAAIVLTFLIYGGRRLAYLDVGIRRSLLLACLSAVVGFSIDAIGNPAWQFPQVSMFFWLILGLGVACARPRNARQESA